MIRVGDCIETLRDMGDATVQTCVTSPPYFGLRDYGHEGQIGLEETPAAYIERIVSVFREVRRVLRDDGTLWLNLGDSYANDGKWGGSSGGKHASALHGKSGIGRGKVTTGLKQKDLIGIPWRVAFALQADGWHLRQDIIWHKSNPMPESVRDRCTKAHEYVFLLSKSPRYYYDHEAVKEPSVSTRPPGNTRPTKSGRRYAEGAGEHRTSAGLHAIGAREFRNKRSVWSVSARPFTGAHFAVFPPDLIRPCVQAGAPEGGVVLDPFTGSGTTGVVCAQERRSFVGIELNPEYAAMAAGRIAEAEAVAACAWDQLPLLARLS